MSERGNVKANILLGALLVLIGLLFNVWVLTALFSPGNELEFIEKTIVWTLDALFILSGLLIIAFRNKIEFINLLLLGGILVVSLILAEVYLRITVEEPPEFKIAQTNPNGTGSYRLKPNLEFTYPYHGKDVLIRTNSLGMRWSEVSVAKPQSVERIAFVGDSFTFGESADLVENSFVGIFESELSSDEHEVLNFGVIGYGLADIELQIQEDILAFNPDYLILMFFNGNDFRDTFLGINKYDLSYGPLIWDMDVYNNKIPEELRNNQEISSIIQESRTPLNNIYLYRLLSRVVEQIENPSNQEQRSDLSSGFDQSNFAISDNFTSFSFWSRPIYPEVALDARDRSLTTLSNIKKIAEENDIELIIVAIPFQEQVYSDLLKGVDENGAEYDIRLPQEYVQEWARVNSVDYLDLLPILRTFVQENQVEIYPPNDVHFNNEGHFVIGRSITEYFREVVSNE